MTRFNRREYTFNEYLMGTAAQEMKEATMVTKLGNLLAQQMFGMTITEALTRGVCVDCKCPVYSFKDEISEKEYGISGLCQDCQDNKYFNSEEE